MDFKALWRRWFATSEKVEIAPFNYRLIWVIVILLTTTVSLVPLIFTSIANYQSTERAFENEYRLRAERVVSNVYRSISFLLTERQAALHFIASSQSATELKKPGRIAELLKALQNSFGGGYEDLGIIDENGTQHSYEGPHDLLGKDYSTQAWFKKVVEQETYVSDVFLGFRQQPHLVVAVKKYLADGTFIIIRTTMNIDPLDRAVGDVDIAGLGDAFIVNSNGVLQTHSRYHGQVLSRLQLPVPENCPSMSAVKDVVVGDRQLLIGYRCIEKTPFILMVVKDKDELLKPWRKTKHRLIVFLAVSIAAILVITIGSVTVLVKKLYLVDRQRIKSMHQIEYEAKMASIGRLAANVSHEINNPLAIINEKAGLMKDLAEYGKLDPADPMFSGLVQSILNAVKRASRITRKLLSFARHINEEEQTLDVKTLIEEVIGFLEKEAELKSIRIQVKTEGDIPQIKTDRGNLQQVFINLLNNAFGAMDAHGELQIRISRKGAKAIKVEVQDTGHGISPEHMNRVFEPFFSTKTGRGGTGLGLYVTYNLLREIGGSIDVKSRVQKGTCFTVTLPLPSPKHGDETNERIAGRR